MISEGERQFVWPVLFVSSDALLYMDESGQRWLVSECVHDGERGVRRCVPPIAIDGRGASLLEVIRAAKDDTLYARVLAALEGYPKGRLREAGVLVEGLPAKTLRVESQVFYAVRTGTTEKDTKDARATAESVAADLRDVIGPITVDVWPGRWDYDVVVVVGSKRRDATGPTVGP